MRKNRRKRYINDDEESKKLLYISLAVVILAIIAFVVTYVLYSNTLKETNDLGELTSQIIGMSTETENSSQTSSSIGKSINEVVNTEENEETEKIAVNLENIVKTSENVKKEEKETSENNVAKVSASEPEIIPDPIFIKPIEGEIIKEFASTGLVYSETLKEWITHNGIDIKAESKTIVKASSDGIIKAIKNDPRYGITVVIEHVNGFTSLYANLLTAEFVKEGENIKQGQTIGTVGNTAMFEIADESHLHFEILKDNEYLNPSEYIK